MVVLSYSLVSALVASSLVGQAAGRPIRLMSPSERVYPGGGPRTLLGRLVAFKGDDEKASSVYLMTRRGASDIVQRNILALSSQARRRERRHDDDVHEHIHEYIDEHDRHHHHDDDHVDEYIHKHIHRHEDHHHDHDHDHDGHRDHDHDHDRRSFRSVYVHTADDRPVIALNVFGMRMHARSANGLLDPVADLLHPALGSLFATLFPALKGLPLVGGVVDVLASTLTNIGGQKIGALLTGNPTPTSSAFVTNPNSDKAQSPIEQLAYQIDASTDAGSPLFLAQLPFPLPTSDCHSSPNATSPVAVAIVLPIVSGSDLRVMCATYNSTASSPSMLIAQPCWNKTTTGPDGSSRRAEEQTNMSQVFAWSRDTGVIQPLWNGTASSSRVACPSSTSSTVAAAAAGGSSPAPQTVTLVFNADPAVGNSTAPSPTVLMNSNGDNSTDPDSSSPVDNTGERK